MTTSTDEQHAHDDHAHPHGHHAHGGADTVLESLSEEETAFARDLRPVHEALKLATLVASGATLLLVQQRLTVDEFRGRLEEARQGYASAAGRARLLGGIAGDDRDSAYLGAIADASRALDDLCAAVQAEDGREDRERIGELIGRLSEANDRMRRIGETFWGPEYVPSGSEGGHHEH